MMLPDCCKNNVLLAVPFVFGAYLLGLVLGLVGFFWFLGFFKGAEKPSLAYAIAGICLLSTLGVLYCEQGQVLLPRPGASSRWLDSALDSCKRQGGTRQNQSPLH